ncbi:MAG: hypothetical protein K2N51_03625 [Lachnospiraceae bacterium]|nr:hypothetical protein [Lachnospiraceae bacterium]
MENNYKNALNKIKLSESEKDKAKALFYEVKDERKPKRKVGQRLFKPVVAIAASVAIILTANTVIPMLKNSVGDTFGNIVSDNYFSLTVCAKELTKTGKVFSDKYQSASDIAWDTEDGGVVFAFDFPIECKGKNIDTITYKIKEGAFMISNPKGESVVIDGEKMKHNLILPEHSKEDLRKDIFTYELDYYKSFTVKYNNQLSDETCIDVVGTSDIWSKEKLSQYKKLGSSIYSMRGSLKKEKEVWDFLTKDQGISCTVTYKDGSTETKNIVISNEIVRLSEVCNDNIPKEKDCETVARCFQIQ